MDDPRQRPDASDRRSEPGASTAPSRDDRSAGHPYGVAVRASGVALAYGGHVALRVDELAVPAGRISAVIGPNGSGKSTLLAAISGLIRPVAGTLHVLGQPPAAARRRVAHVLQETVANAHVPLTVREVVRMGRFVRRGAWRPLTRADRQAVDRAMRRVDIEGLDRRHLSELSGGQRQRVYVAQGLAQEADLILLDEPATGLDVPTQQRFARVLREERAAGRTVIYTTHSVPEASDADHVVLLAG
ncbi:MAG TPA: ABC transporter ATP-binding protein, partial [Nitriliruptorales bacterium]|nr:ABC transporter ATP-binding protein [Nitriliruptorales bacterium]